MKPNPPTDYWLKRLEHLSHKTRANAAVHLRHALGEPEVVSALRHTLIIDSYKSVRRAAAASLGALRSSPAPSDPHAVTSAHPSSGPLPSAPREVISVLCHALFHDSNAEVRAVAAHSLGQIGDPVAIPALEAALADRNASVRRHASSALATLAPHHAAPADRRPGRDTGLSYLRHAAHAGDNAAWTLLWYWLDVYPDTIVLQDRWGYEFVINGLLKQPPLAQKIRPLLQFFQDHGDLRSLPHLYQVLDHPNTPGTLEPFITEAIVGIARRHPAPELRDTCRFLREQALAARSPHLFHTAAREISAQLGAAFPIPAASGAPQAGNQPIPSGSTPPQLPKNPPADLPSIKSTRTFTYTHRSRSEWWMGASVLLIQLLNSTQTQTFGTAYRLIVPSLMLIALGAVLARTRLRVTGNQLIQEVRLGPLRYRRSTTLTPSTHFHWVKPRGNFGQRAGHLACTTQTGRLFRFAHLLGDEDLRQLAEELNAHVAKLFPKPDPRVEELPATASQPTLQEPAQPTLKSRR